jgi:hypothetical protein
MLLPSASLTAPSSQEAARVRMYTMKLQKFGATEYGYKAMSFIERLLIIII